MKQANTLMIQGTASTVGKSILVTGLCRLFAQEGWRVAPFKAQNMALNSWVTRSGGEIGRAQAVQAEAAGIEPSVEMNPILLKPESHSRSQVIVLGRPLDAMAAREYYRHRSDWLGVVEQALAKLRASYDLVIIEGAGSPVELNLKAYDLVNMRVAQLAEAAVMLVGDIDKGGIFASLLGTLMLLEPEDRQRVKGLIVNKFRGDLALWRDGEKLLAQLSGLPVVGTVPFFQDIRIAEEDSVALENGSAALLQPATEPAESRLDIAIVRLPYLSNYDEFDALATEPAVRLHFVASPSEMPEKPDLIILPGTKNTLEDLAWLWRRGLVQHIRNCARLGSAILGICGGYQMLGERVSDPQGVESQVARIEPGLNLLPIETLFAALETKVTQRSRAQIDDATAHGLFAHLRGASFQAYQIHIGRTDPSGENASQARRPFIIDTEQQDGWLSRDGWCAGCYLHGLFENDTFRQGIIRALMERKSSEPFVAEGSSFSRQREYDKLADWLRTYIDIAQLKELCGLTEA
ncbi:cobyric acid synthase [Ktedonosporobacter rubrisoli]|uniref:Cobyric acid synthase n=1 Tax=Ktedonosporobacter rubrisoli TaxID=2509675 RepID=A0A4P6K594_KTERU|nr:cobyric acid synthase [Ktedonosporobacter rubrisoli]QBD82706.1 cobyric acid synthase [Ktedonosporobacter rubrisoli]